MATAAPQNAKSTERPFDINEHFTKLMNEVGLDPSDTGGTITFVGEDPIMESRVRLGAAYSIPYMGTAAAAAMIWKMRTGRGQNLKIDLRKAIHYITDMPWSMLNGRHYPHPFTEGCPYGEESYPTKDGRRFSPIGFYPADERKWSEFLGCPATKEAVAAKIATWNALDLETECNARGMVGGMVRTVEEWANTESGQQLAETPVIEITKIGDSKPEPFAQGAKRPLSGLRVLCNTHETREQRSGGPWPNRAPTVSKRPHPTSSSMTTSFSRPASDFARPISTLKTPLNSRLCTTS